MIQEVLIGDIDAALKTLGSSWPRAGQAVPCLRESFRILTEQGRHKETQAWFSKICKFSQTDEVHPGVVDLVAEICTQHPDRNTRRLAADATRKIVSVAIKKGRTVGLQRMTSSIARLVPKDRICLLYTSPSPRDQRGSRMPSSA